MEGGNGMKTYLPPIAAIILLLAFATWMHQRDKATRLERAARESQIVKRVEILWIEREIRIKGIK